MNKKNNETTLTHLTKRFVKLLNSNSDRVVNLNEASTRLCVAKRRIYDITNVLEGIGLLQKTSKNVTRWVDCARDSPYAAPPSAANNNTSNGGSNASSIATPIISSIHSDNSNSIGTQNGNSDKDSSVDIRASSQPTAQLPAGHGINLSVLPDAELLALLKTYQALEEGVSDLQRTNKQQSSVDEAYVTYHDIKSSFNDQTVIAVKAPPDTKLEVNENLQIAIKSDHGQIEVYLYQHLNNTSNNNNNNQSAPQQQQQQLQSVYQTNANASPHLQQSQQPSNSSNSQPLDATFTNNLNSQQQQQQQQPLQMYTSVSSDEGRGRSTMSGTDGIYYDPTSVSDTDHYYNDPTLSSALSGTISEDEDPFKPIVPFEGREEPHYNFVLDENYTITSLFPEDNLGLY